MSVCTEPSAKRVPGPHPPTTSRIGRALKQSGVRVMGKGSKKEMEVRIPEGTEVLFVEPFSVGSHTAFVNALARAFPGRVEAITMPGTKWHWRARSSGLQVAALLPPGDQIPSSTHTILCSSVCPVAQVKALRPDLQHLRWCVYFHENAISYPERPGAASRDFMFAYTEIMSCLAADEVAFNSHWNMESFIMGVDTHLNRGPPPKLRGVAAAIRGKSRVLYFPALTGLPEVVSETAATKEKTSEPSPSSPPSPFSSSGESGEYIQRQPGTPGKQSPAPSPSTNPLHIVWAHRWEFDKQPEQMCKLLTKLAADPKAGDFVVSICGEVFEREVPECMENLKECLGDKLLHYGYLDSRSEYLCLLSKADVFLSTAIHEFLGVSTVEAMWQGCEPLVPNGLAYVEYVPSKSKHRFSSESQLHKKMRSHTRTATNLRKSSRHRFREKLLASFSFLPGSELHRSYSSFLALD